MTVSGTGHIASLWLRDLTGEAIVDALIGAVYLIIGIGLFGQSRFTLFMGIIIPAGGAWYVFRYLPYGEPIYEARMTIDAMVILCSAFTLWQARHDPSV